MDKSLVALSLVVYALFLFPILFHGGLMVNAETYGTEDGSEKWGYVEVRPGFKIHGLSFFGSRVDPSGSSGVRIGNFQEIGPLDTNLKTRDSTWLKKADLLFVELYWGTLGYHRKIMRWCCANPREGVLVSPRSAAPSEERVTNALSIYVL
ncbi:serine carboxypeptidase-like 51 [Phtheirospermum japonicum]|uniref:Serine carboxypeptidase-like 51 n=1 Tax=Phtheirospermum japonicum TaxID=374723 RepID=A0A830BHX7_9LAMI|nr:serine carboxypeptidase-like 51 [Phtheirospermum japonicum]